MPRLILMWQLHIVELLNFKLDAAELNIILHLGQTLSQDKGYFEITLAFGQMKVNSFYWLNIICDEYQ